MGLAHQLESALTTIRSARLRSEKLHVVQAAVANTADSSTSKLQQLSPHKLFTRARFAKQCTHAQIYINL